MANSNSKVEFTQGVGTSIATHAISEGGEVRHVERFAPGAGIIDMPDTPQLSLIDATGVYPAAGSIDCTGKGRIVISSLFSVAEETADIRLLFYDSEGNVIGYTEKVTAIGTAIEDGLGSYFGELIVVANEYGAKEFKIRVETIPTSGTVTISCGVL